MEKVLNMTYTSSLTDLCEINSSFDSGVLRIAYTGANRNGSYISKDTFERCIRTMFNCPIVCHYDRETDTIGGHDVEIVRDDDGSMRFVNLTVPVGVVPERAKYWWGEVTEDNGETHEYLYTEVLLWKRQEAYRKIRKDGVTAQSMEISVRDGEMKNGLYHIYNFEFNAFAIIGVEPCYESAALEVFAAQDFKQRLSEMMKELKESFYQVTTPEGVTDTNKHFSTEGGKVLDEKTELAAKYGVDPETLDFDLNDKGIDELTALFEAMKAEKDTAEAGAKANDEPIEHDGDQTATEDFALNSNVVEELYRSIGEQKVQREWGECQRYWYVDCDLDEHMVYCWDSMDWLLYGFSYEMDGDSVRVNFESKKRMKYVIAEFDNGEQDSPFAAAFALVEEKYSACMDAAEKYRQASDTITAMQTELDTLRQFKANAELAQAQSERERVFSMFDDLIGVEAFERLRADCAAYDAETLEEKCYAIRGRNGSVAKFSLEQKAPKLMVEPTETDDEPYGGIFPKYGIRHNN